MVFVRKGYLAEPSLLSFLIDFSRWNSLGGISWVEFLRRSFLVGTSLASVSLKRTFLAGFLQVEFPRWNSQGGDSWLEFPGLLFSHGIVLENLADLGGILYSWNFRGGNPFLAGTSLLFLFFVVKLSR